MTASRPETGVPWPPKRPSGSQVGSRKVVLGVSAFGLLLLGCLKPTPPPSVRPFNQPLVGLYPVRETRPVERGQVSAGALAAAGVMFGAVGAAATYAASSSGRAAPTDWMKEVRDPALSLQRWLRESMARNWGARFVLLRSAGSASSAQRVPERQRFTLEVSTLGYGLAPIAHDAEDRAIFYRSQVTLVDKEVGPQAPVVELTCSYESSVAVGIADLSKAGAAAWLQERFDHLAHRCFWEAEEAICRKLQPDLPLAKCVTSALAPEEKDLDAMEE